MATSVVRFQPKAGPSSTPPQWGVLFDRRIAVLATQAATTGEFVRHAQAQARAATREQATLSLDDVKLLSPVTTNQQFICQGVNYESHVRESGLDPKNFPFNTIFTKASSCITGPTDDVVRPRHVQLLDHEIELGLVLSQDLTQAREVRADRLHEVLAGLTIVNDVSARDVQLPQGQFYKGKSHRTFGPVGPTLLLLEPEEWALWPAEVPEDLIVALDATPKAKAFFATINAANRYAILWRIQTAVKPETRAKRIAQLVDMLGRGETLHGGKPEGKAQG